MHVFVKFFLNVEIYSVRKLNFKKVKFFSGDLIMLIFSSLSCVRVNIKRQLRKTGEQMFEIRRLGLCQCILSETI